MLEIYSYHTQPETLIGFENRHRTKPFILQQLKNAHYLTDQEKQQLRSVEDIIATDPDLTYRYANNILRARFEKGEPSLAQKASDLIFYIQDVINSNSVPQNLIDMVLADPFAAAGYADIKIGGEWVDGEKIIATNGQCSLRYALQIANKRFELGENAIKNKLGEIRWDFDSYFDFKQRYNRKFGTNL